MRNEHDNNIALYSLNELQCMRNRIESKFYNPFTLSEIEAEMVKRTITPHCQKQADKLVKYGYSDSYIQCKMYASRDENTSIAHIVKAIELSRG